MLVGKRPRLWYETRDVLVVAHELVPSMRLRGGSWRGGEWEGTGKTPDRTPVPV